MSVLNQTTFSLANINNQQNKAQTVSMAFSAIYFTIFILIIITWKSILNFQYLYLKEMLGIFLFFLQTPGTVSLQVSGFWCILYNCLVFAFKAIAFSSVKIEIMYFLKLKVKKLKS